MKDSEESEVPQNDQKSQENKEQNIDKDDDNGFDEYIQEAKTMIIPPKINDVKEVNPNFEETNVINEKITSLKSETENSLKGTVREKTSQTNFIKSLVSQDKNRFKYDGFDLDLSYITPRIIAMGFPSTSIEGLFRNNLTTVLNFFNTRHKNHYKVYNLCQEKKYKGIFEKEAYYPFRDHEAPPLNSILPFCQDCKKHLDEDKDNVVAIHCLAGKGRTGTYISCLLLYLNYFDKAEDSIRYYGKMRVENGRGVTVPSQIRYVFYFGQVLLCKIPHPIEFKSIVIRKIIMNTVPNVSKIGSSCTPTFEIENDLDGKINGKYSSKDFLKKETFYLQQPSIEFVLGTGFKAKGDVRIEFFQNNLITKDKIFKFWFNTNFLPEDGILVLKKNFIDVACKDKNCKKFKADFKIEVHTIAI